MFIDGFAPWISIHAPHEGERRYTMADLCGGTPEISIHAPHEGERPGDALKGFPAR